MSSALSVVQDKSRSIDVRVQSLRDVMMSARDKLARGIGGLLSPERVIQVACNSIRKTPRLLDCTPASLFSSISEAATYGWVVDGIMGQASLVPFRNSRDNTWEVQLVPGYKGLRDLVRRSGECDVTMDSVHEGDAYEYRGRFELPLHQYGPAPDRRFLPLTHAYVVGRMSSGRIVSFSWTAGECLAHRDRYSQNWKRNQNEQNPWHPKNPAFRVMAMKTVLLDAIHRGEFPMSVDARQLASRAAESTVESAEIAPAMSPADLTAALMHEAESLTVDDDVIDAVPPQDVQDEVRMDIFHRGIKERFFACQDVETADGLLADAMAADLHEDELNAVRMWHSDTIKRLTALPLDPIQEADIRMAQTDMKSEVEAIYVEMTKERQLSDKQAASLFQLRGRHLKRISDSRGGKKRTEA